MRPLNKGSIVIVRSAPEGGRQKVETAVVNDATNAVWVTTSETSQILRFTEEGAEHPITTPGVIHTLHRITGPNDPDLLAAFGSGYVILRGHTSGGEPVPPEEARLYPRRPWAPSWAEPGASSEEPDR